MAREDGGIDIKDDCRLDGASARCHQDGSNAVAKGYTPLVRLAINVSSPTPNPSPLAPPLTPTRCASRSM